MTSRLTGHLMLFPEDRATVSKTSCSVNVEIQGLTIFLTNHKQALEIADAFRKAADMYGPPERFVNDSPEPMADDDVPF